MYSNIADTARTAVYFKSSRYGSYNHSHADQNSFVLTKAGVTLLGESGYYDYYGSTLWSSWYRQSKAHNTITYNGGIGQSVDGYTTAGYTKTLVDNGKINSFSTSTTVDFVEGDATAAYSGALSSAVRKLWYLRSIDAVVVLDKVSSATARTFEWNFHTFAPIAVGTAGDISVTYGGQSVCVTPITSTNIAFAKKTGPTPKTGVVEDHGAFVNTTATLAGEFLILLDVGCKKPAITLTATSTGRTLKVGSQTLTLPK